MPDTELASPPWPAGHAVGGFELQGVLRASAAGWVYRGWDAALARPVEVEEYLPPGLAQRTEAGDVVPRLPEAAALFEQGRQAFVDTSRRLAGADHPRLARVLHLVAAHGTAYRVMPAHGGRLLTDLRREMKGAPDEPALRTLLHELLDALQAFHRLGGAPGGLVASRVLLLDDDHALLLPSAPLAPVEDAAADGHALARVALFCLLGHEADEAPGAAATTLERWVAEARTTPVGPGLLQLLRAALSPNRSRWPATLAEFRTRLDDEQPAPSSGPPVDAAAAEAIRRLIDSLPPVENEPRVDLTAAAPAAEAPPLVVAADDRRSPRGPASKPRAQPGSGGRRLLGWLLGAAVLAAAAVAAWIGWAPPGEGGASASPPAASAAVASEPAPPAEPVAAPPVPAAPPRATPVSAPTSAPAPVTAAAPTPVVAAASSPVAAEPPAPLPPPAAEPPRPPVKADTPASAPKAVAAVASAVRTPAPASAPARVATPREQCGNRTEFALYRCMQQQCGQPAWRAHPQCVKFKAEDRVE